MKSIAQLADQVVSEYKSGKGKVFALQIYEVARRNGCLQSVSKIACELAKRSAERRANLKALRERGSA